MIIKKDSPVSIELEKLYCWSAFYQNSDKLSVPRYPKYVFYKNGWPKTFLPESDKQKDALIQEKIKEIWTKEEESNNNKYNYFKRK